VVSGRESPNETGGPGKAHPPKTKESESGYRGEKKSSGARGSKPLLSPKPPKAGGPGEEEEEEEEEESLFVFSGYYRGIQGARC